MRDSPSPANAHTIHLMRLQKSSAKQALQKMHPLETRANHTNEISYVLPRDTSKAQVWLAQEYGNQEASSEDTLKRT